LVPLKEAHISGAASWSRRRKAHFANDRANLLSVNGGTNTSKGAGEPGEWLPERHRCRYIKRWQTVKSNYNLAMDAAERPSIERVAQGCH